MLSAVTAQPCFVLELMNVGLPLSNRTIDRQRAPRFSAILASAKYFTDKSKAKHYFQTQFNNRADTEKRILNKAISCVTVNYWKGLVTYMLGDC